MEPGSTEPESKRAEVLAAGLRLFATQGYQATTTRDICAEAGLAHTGMYFYFRSKEDLLFSAIADQISKATAGLDQTLRSVDGQPLIERMRTVARYQIATALETSDAWNVVVAEQRHLSEGNFRRVTQMLGSYQQRIRSLIEEGNVAGLWNVKYPKFWVFNQMSVFSRTRSWYRPDQDVSVPEIVEWSVEYVMATLRLRRPQAE